MGYVVFIHGLSNKPAADYLHNLWKRKLAFEDGLDLGTNGVDSVMVYWADVLYPAPDTDLASYESATAGQEAIGEAEGSAGLDLSNLADADRRRIERLASALGVTNEGFGPLAMSDNERKEVALERIPIPAPLRNRLMAKLVRDAHLYFFNLSFSPRPGETYKVRDELRKRFLDALRSVKDVQRPLIVVSHSMGTIIAYDCLMHEPGCPRIDGLMTIGSPLGLDEVQDFFPRWTRENGFPGENLQGPWVNVFDRLDAVAGADPQLANDYKKGGAAKVQDVEEPNWGTWRHSIAKYMQGKQLRTHLANMLRVAWP